MRNSGLGNTRLRDARQGLGLQSQRAFAGAVTDAGRRAGLRLSVAERTVRRWESDYLLTIFLSTTGSGGIDHVVDGAGRSSTAANPDAAVDVVSYP